MFVFILAIKRVRVNYSIFGLKIWFVVLFFVKLCMPQSTIPKSKRIDTNGWPRNVVIIAVFLLILYVFYLCMWLVSRFKIPYMTLKFYVLVIFMICVWIVIQFPSSTSKAVLVGFLSHLGMLPHLQMT